MTIAGLRDPGWPWLPVAALRGYVGESGVWTLAIGLVMGNDLSLRDPDFAHYLRQIKGYDELDRDEELALARMGRGGDEQARARLIEAHLRDVVAIARCYRGYGHALAELVAVGNLGLVRGVDRFDPDRGLRVMTYAGYWVRAEILAYIVASWSVVELGTSSLQTRLFFGLHRQRSRLQTCHGEGGVAESAQEGLTEALARHFDCQPAQVGAMLQRIDGRDQCFDSHADHGTWHDRLAHEAPSPEAVVAAAEGRELVRRRVRRVLEDLDERERLICQRRLLDEDRPSLVALGGELGLSRERVRQIESRVRSKLRRAMLDIGGRPCSAHAR